MNLLWPSVLWAVIFLCTKVTVLGQLTSADVASACEHVKFHMNPSYNSQEDNDFLDFAKVQHELGRVCRQVESLSDEYDHSNQRVRDVDEEEVYMTGTFVADEDFPDYGEGLFLDLATLEAMGFRARPVDEYSTPSLETERQAETTHWSNTQEGEEEEYPHWSNHRGEEEPVCGSGSNSCNKRNNKKNKRKRNAVLPSASPSSVSPSSPWYFYSFDVLMFIAVATGSLGALLIRHRDRMELVRVVLADVFPFLQTKATIAPSSPKSQNNQSVSSSSAKKRRKRHGQGNNGKGKHSNTPSSQQKGSFLATLAAAAAVPATKHSTSRPSTPSNNNNKRRNRHANNNHRSNNPLSSTSSTVSSSLNVHENSKFEEIEKKSNRPVRGISERTSSNGTDFSTDCSSSSESPPPKLEEVTEQQRDAEIFGAIMQTAAATARAASIDEQKRVDTNNSSSIKQEEEEKIATSLTAADVHTHHDQHTMNTVAAAAATATGTAVNDMISPLSYCTQPGSEPPPLRLDVELVAAAAAAGLSKSDVAQDGFGTDVEMDENEGVNENAKGTQLDNQMMLPDEPPRLLSPSGFSALAQDWQPAAYSKQQQKPYDRLPLPPSLSSPLSLSSPSSFNSPCSLNSPSSLVSERRWPIGGGAFSGQAMYEEPEEAGLPSLTREARALDGRMGSGNVSSTLQQQQQQEQEEASYMQSGYSMGGVQEQQQQFSFNNNNNNNNNNKNSGNCVSKAADVVGGGGGGGDFGMTDFSSQPWYSNYSTVNSSFSSSPITSASVSQSQAHDVQNDDVDVDADESNDALVASMVRCLSMENLCN